MEAPHTTNRPARGNIFTRIAGADPETLARAPARDTAAITSHGVMLCATAAYTATTLTLLGERLFRPTGFGHLAVVLGAVSLASLVAAVDRNVWLQASYLSAGVKALKRVGIKNLTTDSHAAVVRSIVATSVRACIAFAFSGLSAILFGLVLYGSDIRRNLDTTYRGLDGSLIAAAGQRVDARIGEAREAVETGQSRVDTLGRQVARLQSVAVDPVGGEPQVAAAAADVSRLEALAQTADAAADSAANTVANEVNGVKTAGSSGVPGLGHRARADQVLAQTAASRAEAADADLAAARQRLATLRNGLAGSVGTMRKNAEAQLGTVSAVLGSETQKLTGLQKQYNDLIQNRAAEMQADLEATPGYVAPDYGLLAQMGALTHIAQQHVEAAILIGLVDFAAFSLEMSFLLSRLLGLEPTVYCAILASQTFIEVAEVADDLVAHLNGGRAADAGEPEILPPDPESGTPSSGGDGAANVSGFTLTGGGDPFAQPKRPRGRPRKNPLN